MKRILLYLATVVGAIVAIVIAINVCIGLSTKPYIYQAADNAPDAEVALIPGAALVDGTTLSSVFQDRADLAIKLYRDGKVQKILVSGDNSTVAHNEVDPVRDYLMKNGVPGQDIFLDHAGFDTYSTMYRAKAIFGVTSMLVASQSFHLPRAVFIARELGMQAYGVNADVGHILFENYVREVFADEKAVLDLLVHRVPEYLGPTIPITADGNDYP